jgi:CheY-like chemotaxis protein
MSTAKEENSKTTIILLVDDSLADQLTVERALEDGRVKCELHTVDNGELAMEWLRQNDATKYPKPDLILLDINMPVMDGIATLKSIRADELLKNTPVIMLTTSDSEHDVDGSYSQGANAYITKPVSEQGFVNAVIKLGKFWFELVTLPEKRQ